MIDATSVSPDTRTNIWQAALVCAVILVCTLPFVGKPFNIDDEIYLRGADQILREPMHPLSGMQKMLGEVMPTYHFTQHPPLVSYYIAFVRLGFGLRGEVQLHLAFLPFALLAGLSMLVLAGRFTRSPTAATLLLVGTPAFLIMSHGIMTDIPFLAFALAATASFVRGVDRRSGSTIVASCVLLTLACFVQYRGLALLPLLCSYTWLRGRMRLTSLWSLLLPAALFGLWCVYNLSDIRVVHFLDAGSWIELSASRIAGDAAAYVSFLGGATIFPFLYIYTARGWLRNPLTLAIVPGITAATIGALARSYGPGQQALLALFFMSGLLSLLTLCSSAAARPIASSRADGRDALFLLLMAVVPLLSQVALNLFASVRSLLIGLPFIVLIAVRQVEAKAGLRRRRTILGAGIALTVICGLTVSLADYQFAAADRDLARDAIARTPPDKNVWFFAEWGFRYYMEHAGYAYMTSDGSSVDDGDLVLMADRPWPARLQPDLADRLDLLETIPSKRRFRLKTMRFEDHAGFYLNGYGLLPFSFSSAPLAGLRIYRFAPAGGPRLPAH